jgi:hypothetical protein
LSSQGRWICKKDKREERDLPRKGIVEVRSTLPLARVTPREGKKGLTRGDGGGEDGLSPDGLGATEAGTIEGLARLEVESSRDLLSGRSGKRPHGESLSERGAKGGAEEGHVER